MDEPSLILDIVPDLQLMPYQQLVNFLEPPLREFHHTPSSIEQLQRLTHASSRAEIGRFGPSVAALAMHGQDSQPDDHLRLYEVLFGRDSLRVAIDLVGTYPALARATLLELAKLQGREYHQAREEEPGRIIHENRDPDDPIARDLSSRLGWGWPYYGTVDATPEFIRTLWAYHHQSPANHDFLYITFTDKLGATCTMTTALDMAVDWILHRLDANPEGILEYQSFIPHGIENQVWKDSWDAYHHKDGAQANHKKGIGSIEVQVTTYDALLDAAELYESLGRDGKALELRQRAAVLREAIFALFWTDDDGGYFVLGTDRDDDSRIRQLKIRTSNMGHTLNSRLLEGDAPEAEEKRIRVIDQLMSREMLAASGIRTLASDELLFRPGAYHNGSVWLWDTHHIAKGMRRLGFYDAADDLDERILNVVNTIRAFPEYVRGDVDSDTPQVNRHIIDVLDKRHQRVNRLEQPPQEVQAWTVAAILATKLRRYRRQPDAKIDIIN
jgi:glycogen debranching enzyme